MKLSSAQQSNLINNILSVFGGATLEKSLSINMDCRIVKGKG